MRFTGVGRRCRRFASKRSQSAKGLATSLLATVSRQQAITLPPSDLGGANMRNKDCNQCQCKQLFSAWLGLPS